MSRESIDRPEEAISAAFRERLGAFNLDVAFEAPARGVTALFGPSGCGKTTVLRCIAGLRKAVSGRCIVNGEVWQDERVFRRPHQRPVGFVFQDASLFPHLSVRRNLLYGAPRNAGRSQEFGFDHVVALFGLPKLLERSPNHLSGGERQRVAIARALISHPALLLMDEPLSALDHSAKKEILPFLERLCGDLSLPIIYVTHDMAEVERLADRLILLSEGRVQAAGRLESLQSNLELPLAIDRDASVILDGVITDYDAAFGLISVSVPGGRLLVPCQRPGDVNESRVRIAATDVSLARRIPSETTFLNVLPARILSAKLVEGQEVLVALGLGAEGLGSRLLARVSRRSWVSLGLTEGTTVYAQVKGVALARERPRR